MNALLGKILIYIVVVVGSGFGGYILNDRIEKPVTIPAAPDCICPQPTVSIQPFEVDKIKGLRSFVYSPQFSGSIQVAGVDSTSLTVMIQRSIDQALQRYNIEAKRGKRTNKENIDWRAIDFDAIAREAADRTDRKLASKMKDLFEPDQMNKLMDTQ